MRDAREEARLGDSGLLCQASNGLLQTAQTLIPEAQSMST